MILIHLEAKNDDLLRQMREWRSPDTFVVGRLGMDRDEQRRYLDDPDPVAAGQRLATRSSTRTAASCSSAILTSRAAGCWWTPG